MVPPHAFLTKWINLTTDNLALQWPLRETSDLPKLVFLRRKLEDCGSKIKPIEWDAYFNWYLEASKCIQDSKIASLQNTISKLTKVKKQLKEDHKNLLRPLSPLAPSSLSLEPASSFPSVLSRTPLYTPLPHPNPLTELSFFSEPLHVSSSPEPIKICAS